MAPLTDGGFTRRYWFGRCLESDWRVGAPVTFWYEPGDGAEERMSRQR